MKKVQAYASGREVVLWCAGCQAVVARLGGMHPVEYVTLLSNDHVCVVKDKSESGN